MTRRVAPRRLAAALDALTAAAAPQTPLARVQAVWEEVAGAVIAAHARPVAERGGVLVVECAAGVWAQELELLAPRLLERLRAAAGDDLGITALRVRVGGAERP
jgi:predicted nucleic acid-binding Zn ribbon protein